MDSATFVDSTSACLEEFHKLLELKSPGLGDEIIQQQLARFNYWASNIGVFASRGASLDTRLNHKNSANYRILLLQLLDILEKNLHAAAVGHVAGTDSDNPEIETSHKDTVQAVGDIISGLNRLSATIRKASARNRNSKAANFVERDDEGNDVNMVYLENVTQTIQQNYPDASSTLCRRLGESISLRRKRVLYSRRHQAKLITRPQITVPNPQILPRDIPEPFPQSMEPSLERSNVPQPAQEPAPIAMGDLPSETAPSIPDSDKQVSTIASSRGSSASTGSMIHDQNLRYPPTPKVDRLTGEAPCPYCSAVLTNEEVSNPKMWRFVPSYSHSIISLTRLGAISGETLNHLSARQKHAKALFNCLVASRCG
jgi:hypothetical protein